MNKKACLHLLLCIVFCLFFAPLSHAGEGALTTDVQGTAAIFLSGRTDVVIPELGASSPTFPLLRHSYVLADFLKETFPQVLAAKKGMVFSFSAAGMVHYFNGYGIGFGPDGETSGNSVLYALGGISGYQGPQGPLVGVFLDDANPANLTPPAALDFLPAGIGTAFETLSPKLGQVFYIGDGYTPDGTPQSFVAPDGATRLFLGIPDGWGFWGAPGYYEDNDGFFSVQAAYSLPDCSQFPGGTIDRPCFYDDFNDNSVDGSLWSAGQSGSGPVYAETNGRLEMFLPGTSNNNGLTGFSASLKDACTLRGDYDIQVDFSLLAWPSANGVRVGLGSSAGAVERVSFGTSQDFWGYPREVYLTHFSDGVQGIASTADVTGKLRLVRTGSTITGYRYADGTWFAVDAGPSTTADTIFSISAWSHDYAFTDQDVRIAFDNMIINKGQLLCPNAAPVAAAGPDQVVECAGPNGTAVVLDGSASSDPDNDRLAYTWTWAGGTASGVKPTVTLPLGIHVITLTVDDGKGGTATDTVTVTVRDTTPPVTAVRSIAGLLGDNGWYRSDVLLTVDSVDSCSGVREIRSGVDGTASTTPGGSASITVTGDGVHAVSFGGVDNAGNPEQARTVTISIDTTPPDANISVTPGLLWPPNHKMVDVLVTGGSADAASGVASVAFTVTDEYGAVQPVVNGFNTTIPLEAWRTGTDRDGRHYTITAVVTDRAGNARTVTTEAVCPHDLGNGCRGDDCSGQ